jgi:hypothetical protein
MKRTTRLLVTKVLLAAFVVAIACNPLPIPVPAQFGLTLAEAAAPQLPPPGSSVLIIPIHVSGQYNASKTNLVKFPAPFDLRVLYVTAAIQAKGGTQGTTTLTVLNAGQAVTNAMDLGTPAAAAVVEATLVGAQQNVAKDAAITADLVITGGSTPTIDNITLMVVVGRR